MIKRKQPKKEKGKEEKILIGLKIWILVLLCYILQLVNVELFIKQFLINQ